MTELEWQSHLGGNLASTCLLRWQPKPNAFPLVEERLPLLPPLFSKKRKIGNTDQLKRASKVVATVATLSNSASSSIQIDRTLPKEMTI